MLLIFSQNFTPRVDYIFKHICNRILGLEIGFTSVIEEFIAHQGPKLSYAKQPMGNEMFVQSFGLLEQSGVEDIEIQVKPWEETYCFFQVGEKSHLPFDIFSAAFYLISRYEEYLPHVKDPLGRFPASESLGYREGFLLQPVVDIWAYKLKSVLQQNFPDITFPKKQPQIHSLIKIEQPYVYIQKGFVRSLAGYLKDLGKFRFRSAFKRSRVLLGISKDPYNVYNWIVSVSKKSKNRISAFFLLGDHPSLKDGFNSRRKKFKHLLKYFNDYNEVGLLFSYNALNDTELLKLEKRQLEETTLRTLRSSMNSDFLVVLPELYRMLVEQEIERDFSMVYEDTPGFRGGTCTPFLFYDLDYEIKTPLVIHPIAFTTEGFNNKYESDSLQRIAAIQQLVERLNGTFSVFFDISDFTEEKSNAIWRNLLSEKLHANE
jgi:hypothetical protein